MEPSDCDRRGFLKSAVGLAAPALLSGANDRLSAAFIGLGIRGMANLESAMKQPGIAVTALCDVYQPNLERAAANARKSGFQPRTLRDFRPILEDNSVDLVCISTPDHWHAYMTIEACRAAKDVYVEKPLSTTIDEARLMLEAARKYERVVQVGTMQRSAPHFQKVAQLVRSGAIGEVKFCRTWNYSNLDRQGIGNPPDSAPPAGLDWDLWLGPAPKRPFNTNRFGVRPDEFSSFRYFWDYAGGMMTDWGVHLLDIVNLASNEAMPRSVVALGGKLWFQDNRETPDTLQATYEYPGFIATYEHRSSNSQSMFHKGYGILFHGSEATLFVDRGQYRVVPEKHGARAEEVKAASSGDLEHWANFLACVRTRQRPVADIATGFRSTVACLLANVSYRSGLRVEWNDRDGTVTEQQARVFASREYRQPWKLTV